MKHLYPLDTFIEVGPAADPEASGRNSSGTPVTEMLRKYLKKPASELRRKALCGRHEMEQE